MKAAQNYWTKKTSQTVVVTGSKRKKKNGDNLNNIRCEASRHFKGKKKVYLKHKINELGMNSKNKNIRDLYRGIN
jgi:ribosomal protein L31E